VEAESFSIITEFGVAIPEKPIDRFRMLNLLMRTLGAAFVREPATGLLVSAGLAGMGLACSRKARGRKTR